MQFPKLLWLHCEAAALLGGRAKGQHAGKNGRQHNWDVPLNIHKSDPEKKLLFWKRGGKNLSYFWKRLYLLDIFCNTIHAEVIWGQIWKSKKKSTFIRQNSKTFKGELNFRRYFHFGDWSYHQKMFEIIILNFFTLKSWKLGPKWKYLLRLLVNSKQPLTLTSNSFKMDCVTTYREKNNNSSSDLAKKNFDDMIWQDFW